MQDKMEQKIEEDVTTKELSLLIVYNVVMAVVSSVLLILLVVWSLPSALISTLLAVVVAGFCGGILCNLRGIFKQMDRNKGKFPVRLKVPFYIRPLTGALTGLFTFFVGNLLITSLAIDASTLGWETLPGRLPYIGVAILAGFAAQEFMEKLKEVAKTLFGERVEQEKYAEIERLWYLYQNGALSEEEFKLEKAKLLGQ